MPIIKQCFKKLSVSCTLFVLFVLPASSNYQLKSYDFGGGGGVQAGTNYSLEGVAGAVDSNLPRGQSYSLNAGLIFEQQSNVPPAPTFSNPSSWYNKLQLILNTGNNPTDTKFAIAISTDNFATTNYVQSDNTVGAALGTEDFQTYTSWGGASGFNIIGLKPNTTYYVKVKARQGQYTESPWGPVASASTSQVSLSFDIDVAATDQSTSPPYSVDLGSLTLGSVTTATNKVWVSVDTNATYGAYIFIRDANAGLKSTTKNYTISSSSTDLSSANEGFGVQNSTATQTSGGPLTALSPYNVSSQNVGVVDTTVRELYSTASSPITSGRGSFVLKAKASTLTPASSDYGDTITLVAAATF